MQKPTNHVYYIIVLYYMNLDITFCIFLICIVSESVNEKRNSIFG